MTDEDINRVKKAYYSEYRKNNRERIRETNKQWRDKNKDKIRQYNQNYWTKKAMESEG